MNRTIGTGKLLTAPCRYVPLVAIAARPTMAWVVWAGPRGTIDVLKL